MKVNKRYILPKKRTLFSLNHPGRIDCLFIELSNWICKSNHLSRSTFYWTLCYFNCRGV